MSILNRNNRWLWQVGLPVFVVLALVLPSLACSPFFQPSLLSRGDEALLAAPVADFYIEVDRLIHRHATFKANVPEDDAAHPKDVFAQTERCAIDDLDEALRERPENERIRLIAAYGKVRSEIRTRARNAETSQADLAPSEQPDPATAIPEGLPGEFEDYLRGALAYHNGDLASAQEAWRNLLARPAAERKYRSVWAAFMLGRCAMREGRPEEALRYFSDVRDLAQASFSDRPGLAAASLGWEARVELDRANYERAVERYLEQAATGDPTASNSLREVAVRILKTSAPDTLSRLARHEPSRQVLTAYLVACGGPVQACDQHLADVEHVNAWLEACTRAGATGTAGADRLAWAAYQTGNWDACERWLALADETSPITQWIRAKLCLRDGKIQEAGQLLSQVARLFPADETWEDTMGDEEVAWGGGRIKPAERARGEWGLLQFARKNYVQALDALLVSGYWADAAYVAERVLRPDELKAYVDRRWKGTGQPAATKACEDDQGLSIRHLLARRLARLGRLDEARAYFSPALRSKLEAYQEQLAAGHDTSRSPEERADRLWVAARIIRHDGMDLMGTECAPDVAIHGGRFDYGPAVDEVLFEKNAPTTLFDQDGDLTDRLGTSVPSPDKRFHYRYVAANVAWEAVQLMSNEDPRRAVLLSEAGGWIKYRDPQAGDRFYRALVYRFQPKIRLGQAALASGVGLLVLMGMLIFLRAVWRRKRPQYSLAWCSVMMIAAAIGLLGGLHWYFAERGLEIARSEWRHTTEGSPGADTVGTVEVLPRYDQVPAAGI